MKSSTPFGGPTGKNALGWRDDGKVGTKNGVLRPYQKGVDRHATFEFAKEDGGIRLVCQTVFASQVAGMYRAQAGRRPGSTRTTPAQCQVEISNIKDLAQ